MSLPLTVTLSITYSPAAPVSDLAPTQGSPPPVPFPLSSPFTFIFRVPPGRKPPSGATPPPFRSSPHFPGSACHAPALPDVPPPRPRISIKLSFCTHTLPPTPTLVPVLYSIFCASPVLGLPRNAWCPRVVPTLPLPPPHPRRAQGRAYPNPYRLLAVRRRARQAEDAHGRKVGPRRKRQRAGCRTAPPSWAPPPTGPSRDLALSGGEEMGPRARKDWAAETPPSG